MILATNQELRFGLLYPEREKIIRVKCGVRVQALQVLLYRRGFDFFFFLGGVLAQRGIGTEFGCLGRVFLHFLNGVRRTSSSMIVHFQPVDP